MKTVHTLLDRSMDSMARFVVGACTAVALAAAVVVVRAGPELEGGPMNARTEVVRLEPVAVTVSKATFDTVRAEAQRPGVFARLVNRKAHA